MRLPIQEVREGDFVWVHCRSGWRWARVVRPPAGVSQRPPVVLLELTVGFFFRPWGCLVKVWRGGE